MSAVSATGSLDLAGRIVLVTGGTGTIGSAIVRHLLASDVGGIRIFSRDEHKQFELRQDLPADERLRFLIGDTRDRPRLERAFEGVDFVFHAAAMKHVFACEYNPFEAVQTNVIGTQNVIEAAIDAEVERVMFASSDKAVNPTSTMGASKLLAEKLMAAANAYRGGHGTIFTSTRFGNVVGSRGSVLPLFMRQIERGGPITVTDRRMTRFIMSIDRAVDLMLRALAVAKGGEVFVLKMSAIRIEDLAHVLRDHLPAAYGLDPAEIEIAEIGRHAGEKWSEELISSDELERCLETEDMYVVLPQIRSLQQTDYHYPGAAPATEVPSSDMVAPLTRRQLHELLHENAILGAPE